MAVNTVSTKNPANEMERYAFMLEQRALEQKRQQAAAAKPKPKPPLTGHPTTRVTTPKNTPKPAAGTDGNTGHSVQKPAYDGEARHIAREQAAVQQRPCGEEAREVVPKDAALAPFQLVRTSPQPSIAAPGSAMPAGADGLIPASQANAATWMSQSVAPSTSLAKLTLPGTHDSAATSNPGYVPRGAADAQHMPLKDQLNNGVRFLDLRFKLEGGTTTTHTAKGFSHTIRSPENLQVYHGPLRQPLSGEEALRTVADFLHEHPREAVVVSIKNEGGGDDAKFQKALEGLMSKLEIEHAKTQHVDRGASGSESRNLFFQQKLNFPFQRKDTVPTFGDAQGSIVLVRRYAADSRTKDNVTLGIDATAGWPNGTSVATGVTKNGLLHVEDHYNNFDGPGTDQEEKWHDVQKALCDARSDSDPGVLHLTFSSANTLSVGDFLQNATREWLLPLPNIPDIIPSFSNPINRQLIDYAASHHAGLGIVAVDRANPDVIRALINTNR